jgi:hypothetical protein
MTDCWWNDLTEVAQLLWWLEDRGVIASVAEAIGVVESPWHWTREHTDMQATFQLERAA